MTDKKARILLLQGPLGPFFADLSAELQVHGCETHRVCFNKGDWHFADADHVVRYHGKADDWSEWLSAYMAEHRIDAVCCYGDSRFYHREARAVCSGLEKPIFCFEEGYVRPGFVTMEEGGNNANSLFPKRFKAGDLPDVARPEPACIANAFRFQFWFATLYYIVKDWRLGGFRAYRHHRRGNWANETFAWVRAGFRKHTHSRFRERGLTEKLITEHASNLFVVPLQVAVDAQMKYHSPYDSVPEFIEETLRSFARNAPKQAHLLIKHHPMDRGFTHYGTVISRLVSELGLAHKVTYAFDVDLEAVLKVAAGCATVNSTVGLQALEVGVPTLTMGTAMISDAGLTSGATLNKFWADPGKVELEKVEAFKQQLVAHTQVAGSFYWDRQVAAKNCTQVIITRCFSG